MKKFLLFSLILITFLNVDAQTTTTKSSIGISLGPSLPIGDFGSKDLNNSESGLANVGGFLAIDYGYKFSKFFGATASLQGSIHGMNKEALASYAVPQGTGAGLSIESGVWKMANVMVGFFQIVPLTKNEELNLEIRALSGYQLTSSPYLKVNISIPGMGSFNTAQESETSGALAYALGAALKYKLSDNIALKLKGDYVGAKPKFSVTTYPADAPVTQKVRQSVTTFNLGLGLAISF